MTISKNALIISYLIVLITSNIVCLQTKPKHGTQQTSVKTKSITEKPLLSDYGKTDPEAKLRTENFKNIMRRSRIDELIQKFNRLTNKDNQKLNKSQLETINHSINLLKQDANAKFKGLRLGLKNCTRRYKFLKSTLTEISVKFKCASCFLFKLVTNKFTMSVRKNKNQIVLELGNHTRWVPVDSDYGRSTVNVTFLKNIILLSSSEATHTLRLHYNFKPKYLTIGNLSNKGGYIYAIFLDDKKIDFWRLTESNKECFYSRSNTTGNTFYGDGYIKFKNSLFKPDNIEWKFNFTTFDENSLLYLAQDSQKLSSYMALYLQNGTVVLDIRYIDGSKIKIGTTNKYNTGNSYYAAVKYWVNTDTREVNGNLLVGNETVPFHSQISRRNLFKIAKSIQYVGGVDEDFNYSKIAFRIPYFFLGSLQYTTGAKDKIMKENVANSEVRYKSALFTGEGCLTLNLRSETFENFTFSFKTDKKLQGVLLSMANGYIDVKNGNISVHTDSMPFHPQKYNQIEIVEDAIYLNHKKWINVSLEPREIKNNIFEIILGCHSTQGRKFRGKIGKMFLNNRPVLFNNQTVADFYNVLIGREKLLGEN